METYVDFPFSLQKADMFDTDTVIGFTKWNGSLILGHCQGTRQC